MEKEEYKNLLEPEEYFAENSKLTGFKNKILELNKNSKINFHALICHLYLINLKRETSWKPNCIIDYYNKYLITFISNISNFSEEKYAGLENDDDFSNHCSFEYVIPKLFNSIKNCNKFLNFPDIPSILLLYLLYKTQSIQN